MPGEKNRCSELMPDRKDSEVENSHTHINRELDREVKARRIAEKALIESRKKLRHARKMESMGTLVAGMAHEINNPVNHIIINMPIIEKIWDDFFPVLSEFECQKPGKKYGGLTYYFLKDNLKRLISDVNLAANRISKIVTDLKNFAKQSYVIDKESIQINNAVKNALRLVQTIIDKSNVQLEVDLAEDLPFIEGNLQNIEQIVLNITLNAFQSIDHDDKEGNVKIVTGVRDKDGKVFISVSDNGRGVDPAISDRIFDPFVTDKHADGGTGLGLSVTYSLVKAHDGEITFQSMKGNGTVFTVCFPTTIKGKEAKILIVDDDESIREMLKQALLTRNRPYFVDEASNGVDACIKLGTYHPDIVILDIFMPEMNGLEVCRAIKTDPAISGIKVIITTGSREHIILREIADLGFTNIHYKPISFSKLFKEIDRLINS